VQELRAAASSAASCSSAARAASQVPPTHLRSASCYRYSDPLLPMSFNSMSFINEFDHASCRHAVSTCIHVRMLREKIENGSPTKRALGTHARREGQQPNEEPDAHLANLRSGWVRPRLRVLAQPAPQRVQLPDLLHHFRLQILVFHAQKAHLWTLLILHRHRLELGDRERFDLADGAR
jgi:hypothetical protein